MNKDSSDRDKLRELERFLNWLRQEADNHQDPIIESAIVEELQSLGLKVVDFNDKSKKWNSWEFLS